MTCLRMVRSICIRTALLCCLVYFSETSSNLLVWNPQKDALSLSPKIPVLSKEELVSSTYSKFLEDFFSNMGQARSKKSKNGYSIYAQPDLTEGHVGQKRSGNQEELCYMPPPAYSKIQSIISMVTDLRGQIVSLHLY